MGMMKGKLTSLPLNKKAASPIQLVYWVVSHPQMVKRSLTSLVFFQSDGNTSVSNLSNSSTLEITLKDGQPLSLVIPDGEDPTLYVQRALESAVLSQQQSSTQQKPQSKQTQHHRPHHNQQQESHSQSE